MRRRPWVLVLAVLTIAFVFSVLILIRYVNRSDWLGNKIVESVEELPGSIDLQKATLGITSLHVYDFQYVSPDSQIVLYIPDIRLSISWENYITERNFIKTIKDVSLSEPELKIYGLPEISTGNSDSLNLTIKFQDFDFLEQILINNAKIAFLQQPDYPWIYLHSLDGWIKNNEKMSISFGASCGLYNSSEKGLDIQGSILPNELRTECKISLDSLNINNIQLPGKSPIDSIEGIFRASFELSMIDDSLEIKGEYNVENGHLIVKGGPIIDEINLDAEIEENTIYSEGSCLFEGDEAELKYSMNLNESYEFNANAAIRNGRLGKHLVKFADLNENDAPEETIYARASFFWSPLSGNWYALGNAKADSMTFPVGTVKDINVDMEWTRARPYLNFKNIDAKYYGMEVDGNGKWTPTLPLRFDVGMSIIGYPDPSNLPDYVSHLNTKDVNSRVRFTLLQDRGWLIEGNGRVYSLGNPSLGEFVGTYSLDGYSVEFDLFSSFLPDASANLSRHGDNPHKLETEEPQILAGWWNSDWENEILSNRIRIGSSLVFSSKGIISAVTASDPATEISTQVFGTTLVHNEGNIEGTYSYNLSRKNEFIGNGELDLNYSAPMIQINKFNFNDYLMVTGGIDVYNKSYHDLILAVEDLDIGDIVERATALPADEVSGLVNGRGIITGPASNPTISANFDLSDGRYKDLHQYWGNVSMETNDDSELEITSGSFGRSETILLELGGKYNILHDSLEIQIESTGSDAGVLSKAFTGNEELIEGKISYFKGLVTGELLLPGWSAVINLSNAKLAGVEFDTVRFDVTGETSKRLGHVVYLHECEMDKSYNYHFSLSGAVPLNRSAGVINASLEGNVLQILPLISDFFVEGEGKGKLETSWMIVSGKEAVIGKSDLKVEDARLKFDDVLPETENLSIDMSIDNLGRLDIKTFTGTVNNGVVFEIENEQGNLEDSTGNFSSILIDDIDFNIGILKARTLGSEGLQIHLPGILEQSENVNFEISGKDTPPDISYRDIVSHESRGEVWSDWFRISGPLAGLPIIIESINLIVSDNNTDLTDLAGTPIDSSTATVTASESLDDIMASMESFTGETELPDELIWTTVDKSGLLFWGTIGVSETEFTYPPLTDDTEQGDLENRTTFIEDLLLSARWDVDLSVNQDVWYTREIEGFENAPIVSQFRGFLDQVSIETMIEPTEDENPLQISGRVGDNSVRLQGELVSNQGIIEFLDQTFRVERSEVSFDKSDILPIVSGRAKANVTDFETGFLRDIYLTLYVIDPQSGERSPRGRWGEFTLVLEGEAGSGLEGDMSQEEILASMGYSVEGITDKVGAIGGSVLTRAVSRRILRPFERDVARLLGLDLVRFEPVLNESFFGQTQTNIYEDVQYGQRTGLAGKYEPGSTIRVGKYVSNDLYLSYTGQLASESAVYTSTAEQGRVGLLQTWNVTYRVSELSPNFVVETGWEYDNLEEKSNRSAKLRYTFNF